MDVRMSTWDLLAPVTTRDHVEGPDDAPVTLVEYADYECPYCRRADHALKDLRRILDDQLRVVYRNFPLRTIHQHAQHAAEAAEAAAHQGNSWLMHDVLFAHQDALDDEHLHQYAELLGLDMDRFDRDMAEHSDAGRIEEDVRGGIRSGVWGTPTLFVNGVRYDGDLDLESLLGTSWEAEAP